VIGPDLYRAGEGEPVVLLHGFMGHWSHWRPVLAELAGRYEVIAPALAGHYGGPELEQQPKNFAEAGEHLAVHLDELGVETAHFVGNSLGGGLAIEMAKRGRARSVVALSPAGGWDQGTDPEAQVVYRKFRAMVGAMRISAPRARRLMTRARFRRLGFRDVMRRGDLMSPSDALELMKAGLECRVTDTTLAELRAGRAHGIHDLDKISAPVLLAWAEFDRLLPKEKHSARYRREIPGAEYVVLPRVGHTPMWDNPRLIERTIIDWVDRHTVTQRAPAASAPATA
jgi:pimeloyl-ACP methyl ester carboxylesterase